MSGRRAERGVALILVLVVLPIVAILMTQLSFETTIGAKLASNALANQQFKQAILARLRQMRLRLVRDLKNDERGAQESGAYDHYSDDWGPELEGGKTAGRVAEGDTDRGDEVELYTEVIDEQGKFNLNLVLHRDPQRAARAQEVLRNLLDFFRDPRFGDLSTADYDLSDAEARELTVAILKFLQGDERDERVRKPQMPDPDNQLRQGVFTIEDLAFCHRLFMEKRLLESFVDPQSGETLPGLTDLLTVYGDGRVNVNTAPIQVLRAYFKEQEGQQEIAERIFRGRGGFLNTEEDREARDETLQERRDAATEEPPAQPAPEESDEAEDQTAYRTLDELSRVEGMGNTSMLRRNEIDVARDFNVRSNFFQVIVTARRGNFLRQHRVVLERHTRGCLTWSSEVRAAEVRDLPETLTSPETGSS